MRKFLMATVLMAVVACGDKGKNAADTTTIVAPAPAPAMTMSDSLHKDSMMKDSVTKDSLHKDSVTKGLIKP
jgi:hypothetical protein